MTTFFKVPFELNICYCACDRNGHRCNTICRMTMAVLTNDSFERFSLNFSNNYVICNPFRFLHLKLSLIFQRIASLWHFSALDMGLYFKFSFDLKVKLIYTSPKLNEFIDGFGCKQKCNLSNLHSLRVLLSDSHKPC